MKKKEAKEVVVIPPKNLPEKKKRKEVQVMPQDFTPENLIMTAIAKGSSIETIEKLLGLRDRLNKEKAEIAFRDAMSKFQSECPVIVKSAGVDYTSKKGSRIKYQYAPLDVIVSAVRNPLSNNGLSYSFTTEQTEKSITAICHAHHILGHSESTSLSIPVDLEAYMNIAQQVASALTYAKRYAFCNAFGILTGDEDNDANKNPEDTKIQEDTKVKEQAEILETLKNLPEDIKQGFKLLGYADKKDSGKAAYLFCKGHKFDNEKILAHLKMLADKV